MNRFINTLLASLALGAVHFLHASEESDGQTIWYAAPADKWVEALPIGNGRLGAMVFGGVFDERIQFNEDTLWKGQPHDYVRSGAFQSLGEIRQLLSEGKAKQAEDVARNHFLSDPVRQKAYQPFGDLRLHFDVHQNIATNYRRELDLATAKAKTSYVTGEIRYERVVFASHPDQAIIVRITANRPAAVHFNLDITSLHTNSQTKAASPDTLILAGTVEPEGLRFESRVHVVCTGGSVTNNGNSLVVTNADAVTLVLVAATSFQNFKEISANPAERCEHDLAAVGNKNYAGLLAAHLADYGSLFRRTTINLGKTAQADLPTDQRLGALKKNGLETDPDLAALYFQFGRYLLISSSRAGGQPANLQGLWNADLNPPWESKWTLNINCEMNYWPAELCNLGECAEPLFAMIGDLAVSGGRTAREQYGSGGWVAHHNTDLWRGTAPINNIDGIWPTGGAWLCYHLWEHYLFTGDKEFLARAYPLMKGASQFFLDYLVKDAKTGWLVTSPSFSPEEGGLCAGPTMDNQIVRALLDSTRAAAGILETDKVFAAEVKKTSDRLPPNQVGKYGQLQEWLDDVDVPNNNHRHMSPLWALYPGADISPAEPKTWDAAKLLLKWRGPGSTGWSYAWRIPLWARAGDGDYAFQQLNSLLQKRTLPNLFDLCGPFQIDGNFGATAGIAEMLLQSQWKEKRDGKELRIVQLLPALPKAWPDGSVKGLCARDGFVLDLDWKDGVLTRVAIHSKLGKPCLLRNGKTETVINTQAGKDYVFDGNLQPANAK